MNIGIIGLGPFCKQNYIKFIQKYKDDYNINIEFLVDVIGDSESIASYLQKEGVVVGQFIFAEGEERFSPEIEKNTIEQLERVLEHKKIDVVIISTEPKSGMIPLEWDTW